MWHTSRGDRTLHGDESILVREAIDTMIDGLMVHLDDELDEQSLEGGVVCESGIALFDVCSPAQRVGLLHEVAKHLLTDTAQSLPLSATLEATVAAIFVDIRDHVAIEIDFHQDLDDSGIADRPGWRHLVASAYRALTSDDEQMVSELPDENSRNMRQWEDVIEFLTDAILWDRDFEMADSFLDVDPGVSHQRRRLLGIERDYFTRVAPDPRPDEVFGLVSKTREIVRAKPR